MIASGGTLSIAATNFVLLGPGRTLQINSGATMTMDSTARLYMDENAEVQNAGNFNANGNEESSAGIYPNSGSGQLLNNTGTFTRNGTGAFTVDVPFDNDGTVEIATGILGATSYTQSATGTLHLHVGGLEAGTGFTQLNVSGAAAIGGTLEVTTESGFTPTEGQGFPILNANPLTNTFSSINGTPGGGLAYTVQYHETGATLVVGGGVPRPTVVTKAASSVTQTTANVSATVNPNGAEVGNCKFEYGTTTAYGSTAPCFSLPGNGSSAVEVSASLAGLTAGTTYHFRISATSPGGTSKGSDETFKTLPGNAPTVVTGSATSITQTSATLSATVNPNGGEVTDCKFEYGTTTAYGSTAPCVFLPGNGSSAVDVFTSIGGLTANTTYHFRISATNPSGTSKGSDESFKTLPGNSPTVVTGSATSITQTSANLSATVNPNGGEVSDCKFEYGTTTAYGSTAPCSFLPGNGTGAVGVSASLSSLSANTTYHFRISATNPGGTSKGLDETFKTLSGNAPTVVTGSATSITQTSANLSATVNPNGGEVSDCKFEYGTTTAYGSTAPCSFLPGNGTSAVGVSASLSSLSAGTTYHFRISATNPGGTSKGLDESVQNAVRKRPDGRHRVSLLDHPDLGDPQRHRQPQRRGSQRLQIRIRHDDRLRLDRAVLVPARERDERRGSVRVALEPERGHDLPLQDLGDQPRRHEQGLG